MSTRMLLGCLSLLLFIVPSSCPAQDIPYSIGSWPEAGNGNHRAVLQVSQAADAVWAHIDWRRRDLQPETKDIRIVDAQTAERIMNVAPIQVTREFGDLVFQPKTVPGKYYVYYLPYDPPGTGPSGSAWKERGNYFLPEDTAVAAWREKNGLTEAGIAVEGWRSLPRADVIEIQARGEFHRMDPMEVIATTDEVTDLLARYPDQPYLLFPEDRQRPIRMTDDLPLRWVQNDPSGEFSGEARPGEYYCFQIGVFAARQAIPDVSVDFADLVSGEGARISTEDMTCFNLEGTDWLGRPIENTFALAEGKVRPLWIGLQVPRDAAGTYEGAVTVRPEGAEATTVRVALKVAGDVIPDSGDADLWRHSRLRWLNSTLGIDDGIVPPFTPLEVEGSTVKMLGREIDFGPIGLPVSIRSNDRELLDAPVALDVVSGGGAITLSPAGSRLLKATDGVVERETVARGDGLTVTTRVKTECDGCVSFRSTLKADEALDVDDIALVMPLRREAVPYMMGMSRRGGKRPAEWTWKWNIKRADNMVWLGGTKVGVQLKLIGPKDVWQLSGLEDTGIPQSWGNAGKGGCDITEAGDRVTVRAFTGGRTLEAGSELELRYRFLVTPFKPIDPRHWNWRYGDVTRDGTVRHIHHGMPQNPYINYPFHTTDQFAAMMDSIKAIRTQRTDFGALSYPAKGNIEVDQGTLHVWVTLNFDPHAGEPRQAQYNQALFALNFPKQDQLGFYWNIDDRGMRAYVRRGAPEKNQYPMLFGTHSPDWEKGQQHLLSLSWGKALAVFVDGERLRGAAYEGILPNRLDLATLDFKGDGFVLDAIKITRTPYSEGEAVAPEVDEDTLLLDTFSRWDGGEVSRPLKSAGGVLGRLEGVVESVEGPYGPSVHLSSREEPVPPKGANIYYTVRELSNHVAEMWALRSLGDEVLRNGGVDPYTDEIVPEKLPGGYAWLREHLGAGYIPAWRTALGGGDVDAAIATQYLSRWHNYYVEGMQWLMDKTGLDGLYLDGIGYDREIMKRIAKVMFRRDPNSRINFHSGDGWSPPWDPGRYVSPANQNMEHFPYISNLWFGEIFDYNMPPDYWLVEISGIPFGLTGEMLNYQTGGNAYRGMVYGMTSRQHPSHSAMWRLWDEFGIQDAEMIGYWDDDCPVRTNHDDVLATVYRKPDKSLIALGRWPEERPRRAARTVPAKSAPTIDGTLAESEWDGAARLSGFTEFDADGPAEEQTEIFVTYDATRLYIACRCDHADPRIKADVAERDGPTWEDDAVEVFIQPDLAEAKYYQLVGNSTSVFADCVGTDTSWDGDWVYRSSRQEGRWEAEMSVSFASLGMAAPVDGDVIGVNFCRDRQTPRTQLSCWAPSQASFHNVGNFGRLAFSETGPATLDDKAVFPVSAVNVRLKIDWEALGLDADNTVLSAPAIAHFQDPAKFGPDEPIPVQPGKGRLLIMEER